MQVKCWKRLHQVGWHSPYAGWLQKNANEIAFTSLSDVPLSDLTDSLQDERLNLRNETVTISTNKEEGGHVTNHDSSTLPQLKDLEELAKQERIERKLDKNDVLFIAVGWIVLDYLLFAISNYVQKSFGVT